MNVYFGPYLRVPAVLVDVPATVQACSADCSGAMARTARGQAIREATRFCPDCGAPTAPRTTVRQERRAPQPHHVADLPGRHFTDLMASAWPEWGQAPHSVWTPNQGRHGVYLDEADSCDLPLPDEAARADQLARFLEAHRPFMEAAEAQLGVAPQEGYGLVLRHG
jgi:hypothetical protein